MVIELINERLGLGAWGCGGECVIDEVEEAEGSKVEGTCRRRKVERRGGCWSRST
jgi:hypothetical protein